uniref:CSON009221 protein n=1 Tax=Culicoides sonorensis TaxID=179676 RepID=A0A336M2D5_CULSO
MKFLIVLLGLVAYAAAQCPTIVSRAEWGARPGSSSTLPIRPAPCGLPVSSALAVAKQLMACGVSLGHVSSSYYLIGHRQAVATECPGNRLYQEIQTWPRWKP